MADKTKTKKNKNLYKGQPNYNIFMGGPGLLTEEQHKSLSEGKIADLSEVPEKQMKYLITNNLIKGE